MNKSSLFVWSLFLCLCAQGQTVTPQVLSSNGGTSQNTGGAIDWTIGEPVIATYISSNHIATMGFHQPVMSLIELISENKAEAGFLVYPNPVRDQLTIDFKGMDTREYSFTLNDAAGKLILEKSINSGAEGSALNLQLSGLSAGSYFLQIKSPGFSKTVKINKVP